MTSKRTLLILVLNLLVVTVLSQNCDNLGPGYKRVGRRMCEDIDECDDVVSPCGDRQDCINTVGSYDCKCEKGFTAATPRTCIDINECMEDPNICGPNANCTNTIGNYYCTCEDGFINSRELKIFHQRDNVACLDVDECVYGGPCGKNAACHNTIGSYNCVCNTGFKLRSGKSTFTEEEGMCEDICTIDKTICGNGTCHRTDNGGYHCACHHGFTNYGNDESHCADINECVEDPDICGPNTKCTNTIGNYYCICEDGLINSGELKNFHRGDNVTCSDICTIDKTICGNGTCHRTDNGGYLCACHAGFTNYGNDESQCAELKCDAFTTRENQTLPVLVQNLLKQLNDTCLDFTTNETPTGTDFNADLMLKRLLTLLDKLMSGGDIDDNKDVSTVLNIVENAVKMMAPMIKTPNTQKSKTFLSNHTELEISIRRDGDPPQGPLSLTSSEHAHLEIQWETAAGIASSYPGFTTVSLLSYKDLESVRGIKPSKDFQINSKVVTASVSNKDTDLLKDPVVLTFGHLKQEHERNHVCVYWDSTMDGGAWSPRGCSVVNSTSDLTVCSCNHLSSFAVLMALYDFKHPFELELITYVGLSLSLLCLLLCILTFAFIRSIQSPRNTIHLHLCVSLFIANLIFLAGISRTENQTGCAVVAGLLHFFYLAAFCWMCLEGIQLFRMVVLVFNTAFKPLYMMTGGYGVPAAIVIVSAIANSKGYGTKRHCWLSLEGGFIWGFFGPACAIIMINIFFFLITVWKLAQKFSSLNPDLDKLRKIKAFIITAVAQLCVLGTMWIFGCFQFDQSTIALSYLFTLLNSLQGVMLFVLHCLLSKPVREEYGKLIPRIRSPQKKRYSDFSNSQSSKAQLSKSGLTQNTGESRI